MNADSPIGAEATPKVIGTVEALIEYIELTGLRAFEISGKRSDKTPDDGPQDAPGSDTEPSGNISMQIMESHGPDFIETRFRVNVEGSGGDYIADFGLHYSFSEPLQLEQAAIEGLLSRVAVMSAWPFIREAVATTAARMELEVPVLGLVKQGQFEVSRVDSLDD
jgi:hypothetical protein